MTVGVKLDLGNILVKNDNGEKVEEEWWF